MISLSWARRERFFSLTHWNRPRLLPLDISTPAPCRLQTLPYLFIPSLASTETFVVTWQIRSEGTFFLLHLYTNCVMDNSEDRIRSAHRLPSKKDVFLTGSSVSIKMYFYHQIRTRFWWQNNYRVLKSHKMSDTNLKSGNNAEIESQGVLWRIWAVLSSAIPCHGNSRFKGYSLSMSLWTDVGKEPKQKAANDWINIAVSLCHS